MFEELGSLQAVVDQLGISYNAASKHLRQYRRLLGETDPGYREAGTSGQPVSSRITPRQRQVKELFNELGSQSEVARALGLSVPTVREKLIQYERNRLLDEGGRVLTLEEMQKGRVSSYKGGRPSSINVFDNVHVLIPKDYDPDGDPEEGDEEEIAEVPVFTSRIIVKPTRIDPPAYGVKRILVTSAQDATTVHQPFWDKWNRYAQDLDAVMVTTGFTYGKSLYEDHATQGAYFASEVEQHMARNRIQIGETVDICGEMNTLPTAVTPLSGLQAFTGARWGIFPHAKQQLESVHRMPQDRYKANMTTGTCTLPNYIPKKSGVKAEALHALGGVVIEILPDGRTWARHISADPETGSFHDLDVRVDDSGITRGNRIEALQYGDVHHEHLEADVALPIWGYDPQGARIDRKAARLSLFEKLRPKYQLMHDLSDFAPRNHHNIGDRHFRYRTFLQGRSSVEHELRRCARFLELTRRDWCTTVVVESNHDNALTKWMKNKAYDPDTDEINALFWYETQAYIYRYMRDNGGREPFLFRDILRGMSRDRLRDVHFLTADDSLKLTPMQIEQSQHGDRGAGGRPGSPSSYVKIATLLSTGHTHAPGRRDNLATPGVLKLDLFYNKGLTNWAICNLATQQDGSRQLLFMEGDRFHA